MSDPTRDSRSPDPQEGNDLIAQAAFTTLTVAVSLAWPDLIPLLSVLLAALVIKQR